MRNSQCARLVRAFFIAATKSSDSAEDILPQARTANSRRDNTTYDYNVLLQEDGEHAKLSVFHIFCELFPEIDAIQGFVRQTIYQSSERSNEYISAAHNKKWRLHFNKIGYQIYGKEQSRRVSACGSRRVRFRFWQ